MSNKMYSIREAAEFLGLSPKTIYKYTTNGVLESIKYGTQRRSPVRLEHDVLVRFKQRCRREAL